MAPSAGYFLNRLSKAARASSGVRGASVETTGEEAALEVSRATVTRGLNHSHSFALSFDGMRSRIGFRHWNRAEGSK
jgi:hypothetical protein